MESKKAVEAKKKTEAEAGRMLKEAEQKGRLIIEEAKKKADALSGEILKEVEQKGLLIIEEARKKADAETRKTLQEVEQKGRLIIEEAKKKADAEANKRIKEVERRSRLIVEEARKKAASQVQTGEPAPDVDQKARQVLEEAKMKAQAEVNRITIEAEQKGRQIIEGAHKAAVSQAKASKPAPDIDSRANEIIAEAERKARQIIEETSRIAVTPTDQRTQQLMKAVKGKATSGTKGKTEPPKAPPKKRAEIVVIPPVDFAQLEKLRMSLQRLPGLRILSIGGSPDGGTRISIKMDKPASVAENIAKIDVVEEAIEEEAFDSHQLGDFLKIAMPRPQLKKSPDEQRILVVLKRAQ